MSAADEGRTERATEKQRKKFRDEGSVAKSQELNSLFSFLAGYMVLTFLGSYLFLSTADLMRQSFAEAWKMNVPENLEVFTYFYILEVMWLLTPIFVALFVGVVAVNIMQFGFHVTFKAIKPKWSKINPIANFRKVLFSKNSIMELIKSVAKMVILSLLAWLAVAPLVDQFAYMSLLTPMQIGMKTWEFASEIWFMIILFIGILGIADYSWQRYQLEEKMKMKPQDVKDEMKQAMGDPLMKQEQRRRGMQMLQKLLSEQTREADVIITNPTHFAVALQYKHGIMGAPKVVARGVDYMAIRIKKIARQTHIPIVENRSLARALYFSTDVGDEIPEQLFKPVAEILAFIFKLNKERAAHG